VGAAGFLLAACTPVLLWHRPMAMIAEDFRLEVEYLITGWTGYGLIAVGLLFFLPVVLSIGRNPEARFFPRHRGVYAAWGGALYVLGIALASQVAIIASGPAAH
jgi:hypothetical protein